MLAYTFKRECIKIWKTMLVFAYYNIFIDYVVNGWGKTIEIVKNLLYSLCLFSNGQHVTVMWLVFPAVKMDEEPVSDIMPSYSPIQTSSRNNMTVTIVGKVRCFNMWSCSIPTWNVLAYEDQWVISLNSYEFGKAKQSGHLTESEYMRTGKLCCKS